MRLLGYARISQDRSESALGVQRQVDDIEAWAARQGHEVVRLLVDNDVSATSGVRRPAFEELLSDISQYEGIVVWRMDRLQRTSRDLQRVIDADVPVFTVMEGILDLTGTAGRLAARLAVAIAEEETRAKQQRLSRKMLERATAGAWHGKRCFGYLADGTVVPEEADIIRKIVGLLLISGRSTAAVVRWLNSEGVTTVQGRPWTVVTLRQMICSARLSGQREHTPVGTQKRSGFGRIVSQGQWESIIEAETTARLRLHFSRPYVRPREVKHYLSGLVRCAICGHTLSRRAHENKRRWQCIRVEGTERCGRISISESMLLQSVDARMVRVLEHDLYLSGTERSLHEQPEDLPSFVELDARVERLATQWAAGRLPDAAYESALDAIDAERERVTKAFAPAAWGAALYTATAIMKPHQPAPESWSLAPSDLKRALITDVVESITVRAATPGVYRDPSRVSIKTKPRL